MARSLRASEIASIVACYQSSKSSGSYANRSGIQYGPEAEMLPGMYAQELYGNGAPYWTTDPSTGNPHPGVDRFDTKNQRGDGVKDKEEVGGSTGGSGTAPHTAPSSPFPWFNAQTQSQAGQMPGSDASAPGNALLQPQASQAPGSAALSPQASSTAAGGHVNPRFLMQDGSTPQGGDTLPGLGPSGYQFHGGQHDLADPQAVLERAGLDYTPENLAAYKDWIAQTEAVQNDWRHGAASDPNVQAQRQAGVDEYGAMAESINGFGQNGQWGTYEQRLAAANSVNHPSADVFQAAAIRNQPLDAGGGQAAATAQAMQGPYGGSAGADPAVMQAIAARNAAASRAGRVGAQQDAALPPPAQGGGGAQVVNRAAYAPPAGSENIIMPAGVTVPSQQANDRGGRGGERGNTRRVEPRDNPGTPGGSGGGGGGAGGGGGTGGGGGNPPPGGGGVDPNGTGGGFGVPNTPNPTGPWHPGPGTQPRQPVTRTTYHPGQRTPRVVNNPNGPGIPRQTAPEPPGGWPSNPRIPRPPRDPSALWGQGGATGNRDLAGGEAFGGYYNMYHNPDMSDQAKNDILVNTGKETRARYAGAGDQIQRSAAATGASAGVGANLAALAEGESGAINNSNRQARMGFEQERQRRLEGGLSGLSDMYGTETSYVNSLLGGRSQIAMRPRQTANVGTSEGTSGGIDFGSILAMLG